MYTLYSVHYEYIKKTRTSICSFLLFSDVYNVLKLLKWRMLNREIKAKKKERKQKRKGKKERKRKNVEVLNARLNAIPLGPTSIVK